MIKDSIIALVAIIVVTSPITLPFVVCWISEKLFGQQEHWIDQMFREEREAREAKISAKEKKRFDFWNRLAEYGDGSTGRKGN